MFHPKDPIFIEAKKRTSIENQGINIMYCQSLNMCANLYAHFLYELGDASYYLIS